MNRGWGRNLLLVVVAGVTGGGVCEVLGIPAGALLGSAGAVGLLNAKGSGVRAPMLIRVTGRGLVGASIGSLVSGAVLRQWGSMLLWGLVFAICMIALGALCGVALSRLTSMTPQTSMVAVCPGGMSEMVATGEQVGADLGLVVGAHLMRKVLSLVLIGVVMLLGQ